jgi:hypothetical protein
VLIADQDTADELRAALADAQQKLEKVEAALREAAAAPPPVRTLSSGGTREGDHEDREDEDHEDEPEHDDD